MLNRLKFWKWFRKPTQEKTIPPIVINSSEEKGKTSPQEEPWEKGKIYPAGNLVMITTEANLTLKKCKVYDDHKIEFGKANGRGKKKVDVKEDRPPHVLELPLRDMIPTRLGRIGVSKKPQRYLVYTVQQVGEITHDPHQDGYDEKEKVAFEKVIQLKAIAMKADIAGNIMAGLKEKGSWWETLGWGIIICVIVFFFLFAFVIQPQM